MRLTVWHEQSELTGRYSVRWYDPATGSKRRVLCETFRDVQTEKARIKTMLANRKGGKGDPDAMPSALVDKYLLYCQSVKKLRASTIEIKRHALTMFLRRGTVVRLANINEQELRDWLISMEESYQPDTIGIRLRQMRAFLNWCVKVEKVVQESPFKLDIPAGRSVGRRITPDELVKLDAACAAEFRPYFVLSVETGARRTEVLGMDWNEVNLADACWTIPKERCKTKITRTLPLTDEAVAALRSILGHENAAPTLGPVFVDWTKYKVRYHWRTMLKRSGIVGRLRIHDLRHTFASQFRGRWQSLKVICGWKTDAMASHYTHTTLQELREDMAK